MTVTKTAGAVLGALLILLLGKWAAEVIFHVGGHGEPAYVIDTGGDEATQEAAPEMDLGEMLAAADTGKGEKVFKKCAACHKLEDGANGTGPHLYGVVGRAEAGVDGFSYSDALTALGGTWTAEALDHFLAKPSDYAPGTKMSFAGLPKAEDRANLIAFLNTNSANPVTFEAAAAEAPAETPAAEAPAAEAPAAETAETPAETPAAETQTAETPAAETPAETPAAEAPAETPAAEIAGDPAAGEKVFKKCAACHKMVDGKNGVGPHLYGVVGRDIASVDGFKFSSALQGVDGIWTAENLDAFLAKPSDFAKGTKMTFAGLPKPEDRANVIAYINSASH